MEPLVGLARLGVEDDGAVVRDTRLPQSTFIAFEAPGAGRDPRAHVEEPDGGVLAFEQPPSGDIAPTDLVGDDRGVVPDPGETVGQGAGMAVQRRRHVYRPVEPGRNNHPLNASAQQDSGGRVSQFLRPAGIDYEQNIITLPGCHLCPGDHLARKRACRDAIGDEAEGP